MVLYPVTLVFRRYILRLHSGQKRVCLEDGGSWFLLVCETARCRSCDEQSVMLRKRKNAPFVSTVLFTEYLIQSYISTRNIT
jgi:hypothetical protein